MEKLIAGADRLDIELDKAQVERFQRYYGELVKWNERANLTSVTAYEEVQTRHFLDSLTVVPEISAAVLNGDGKILDIGSGAGFPGLPLKIAHPELSLTLMEATAKKSAFLSHVVESLGLEDVEVVTGRAEDQAHKPKMREQFDIVISRALAKLNVLVELCLPFCSVGGLTIAQKGRDIDLELREAQTAIDTLGGKIKDSSMPDTSATDVGTLVVIEKLRPTPANYPRRPGIPSKRPL
jgi:16S rRNA (guanine527-N7)-methyltransferase